jgi:prepilin-type processing-associated H-X9-DG protein
MTPTKIQLNGKQLTVLWSDGHVSRFEVQYLRDQCPCATCKNEREQGMSLLPLYVEGKYIIMKIEQVGSYAISMLWGDGHATGIYSWDYLVSICPCEDHANVGPAH